LLVVLPYADRLPAAHRHRRLPGSLDARLLLLQPRPPRVLLLKLLLDARDIGLGYLRGGRLC
jgi:hypothetical protein